MVWAVGELQSGLSGALMTLAFEHDYSGRHGPAVAEARFIRDQVDRRLGRLIRRMQRKGA